MSADSQQIDITPYRVRRENVVSSQQQKTSESRPNNDLASSILEKLTEIKDNLYPTHLNIPPQKFGISSLTTSTTKNNFTSLQILPNPERSDEAVFKKEPSGKSPKSAEGSPTHHLRGSSIEEPQIITSKLQSYSEGFPQKNFGLQSNQENINPDNVRRRQVASPDYMSPISTKSFPQAQDIASNFAETPSQIQSINQSPINRLQRDIGNSEDKQHNKSQSLQIGVKQNLNSSSSDIAQNKLNESQISNKTAGQTSKSRAQLLNSLNQALQTGSSKDITSPELKLEGSQQKQGQAIENKKVLNQQNVAENSQKGKDQGTDPIKNSEINPDSLKRFSFGYLNDGIEDIEKSDQNNIKHKNEYQEEQTTSDQQNFPQKSAKKKTPSYSTSRSQENQSITANMETNDKKDNNLKSLSLTKIKSRTMLPSVQEMSKSSPSSSPTHRQNTDLSASKVNASSPNKNNRHESPSRNRLTNSPVRNKESSNEKDSSSDNQIRRENMKSSGRPELSKSPPKRTGQDSFDKTPVASYVTIVHEKQEKKANPRSQPETLKNLDEAYRENPNREYPNQNNEPRPKSTNRKSLKDNSRDNINQNTETRQPSISQKRQAGGGVASEVNVNQKKQVVEGISSEPNYSYSGQANPSMFNTMPPPMNNLNPMQMQMPMQMPMYPNQLMQNFGNDMNSVDQQKYILMIMNYYETHLNHMKRIIVQQNEAISQERNKTQSLEKTNNELKKKLEDLEKKIKEQTNNLDVGREELKKRYEIVLDELTTLKRDMLTKQTIRNEEAYYAKSSHNEGKEYQNMLYHEILSLRKDLENQREIMHDFRFSTRHLEGQIKELEKMYIEEMKNNATVNAKREQLQESLEKYKNDYIKMDTLNRILLEGYEKTKSDLNNLKSSQTVQEYREPEETGQNIEQDQNIYILENNEKVKSQAVYSTPHAEQKERPRRDIYIRSISPQKYDAEENNHERIKNRMRAQDSQVKDLLNWDGRPAGYNPNITYAHTFTSGTNLGSTHPNSVRQSLQTATSNNPLTSPGGPQAQVQAGPDKQKFISATEKKPKRSNVVFPSFQRIEDNKEEIARLDQRLVQLNQQRKILENEIFKMPSVTKTIDQKRKKAGLEMELEGLDYEIEECKNKLRTYDVLNVKCNP